MKLGVCNGTACRKARAGLGNKLGSPARALRLRNEATEDADFNRRI